MKDPRTQPLYVTKPIAPNRDVLFDIQNRIIDRGLYSNFAPSEQELTQTLARRFGCDNVLLFNNGTIALLALLLALPQKSGTILTSPFTFPATVHCIRLAGYKVKFVDIDRSTLNIDVTKLAENYDSDVVGVLAVHVYGNPCDTSAIKEFCEKYDLFELYDAAHCFDVFEGGSSVYKRGVASMASLHATKLMHTGEGGALFFQDGALLQEVKSVMNFGIRGEDRIDGLGLNGKLNEFNAAVGLSVLPFVSVEISRRKEIAHLYDQQLRQIPGVSFPSFDQAVERNYQYYPVLFDPSEGLDRDRIWAQLRARNIFARKYFYPLVSDCQPYRAEQTDVFSVAANASRTVLCLPMHSGVTAEDVEEIVEVVIKSRGA
ncbi:hypothetical protein CPJ18_26180 [Agrobacterium rosae]|uniref:Uncharacterized protein n=1 Tax=Agrobacterium rosae TaxID=1972867 RepID=A0AAE5RSQ9_9HYPH|nr:DegT/DnrJ/EryC1/StrS family aminotransferase [Agrobacterium rosae]POO48415.1 hypothetical protein CPJ18_26180 [Agrobacterium rosae]